jgi:aspartyl-tRNA(Asn)/glutamyl-tRNA(Gln) amidotransferase subunit A
MSRALYDANAMAAIHDLSAGELAAQFANGALSPVEAARACLDRIEAWESRLNAMYRANRKGAVVDHARAVVDHARAVVDHARVMAAAGAAEARWHAKQPLSPLDGVPITIKENIYTRGDPAAIGTRANEDAAPQPADAPPAARVREAGCVLLGKTTMPDFGMLSSGLSSIHGITRNPWRLDRNTSGSSAGAAAAAAAGYAPLHLGTDIGGSVRLPATHCGVFALKPSLGRVPIYPPYIGRVAGPITRTVADSALLMNVLSRPDARDFMSLPYEPADYSAGLDRIDVRKLRIGFLPDLKVGLPVHPEVGAAAQAAPRPRGSAGAKVEEKK